MTPILSVRSLGKRYGQRWGCRDISFDLYPGEVLCIVGESGSGKSTLLSTLAGRLPADAGEVGFVDQHGTRHDLIRLAEAMLTLAESGHIEGEVNAGAVVLSGRLDGDVHAAERIEDLKSRGYATAGLYDPAGVGGTHVMYVLHHADKPGLYNGLPENPAISASVAHAVCDGVLALTSSRRSAS